MTSISPKGEGKDLTPGPSPIRRGGKLIPGLSERRGEGPHPRPLSYKERGENATPSPSPIRMGEG